MPSESSNGDAPAREATARRADELVRTVSTAGGIAVRVMVGTNLVAEAARRHATSPTASAALGRALMGAVLLAAGAKHGETVQLQFRGNGPLGTLTAISDGEARVRGYASHPHAHPAPRNGELQIGQAVGRGILAVVRHRPGWREPYSGIVQLVSGTIAQDVAHYLSESEQISAAISLGVFLDGAGGVEAAAGFFAQALPDASEDEIDQVESNIRGFPGPGELVRSGMRADDIVDRLLAGLGGRERERQRPAFHCPCGRDRVLRAVALLGAEEVGRAHRAGEEIEVHCEFCRERYVVEAREVESLLEPEAR